MTRPRDFLGCVVAIRDGNARGYATVRRAWHRRSDGALTRVVLAYGSERTEERRRVVRVERVAAGELRGLRVLVLGGTW